MAADLPTVAATETDTFKIVAVLRQIRDLVSGVFVKNFNTSTPPAPITGTMLQLVQADSVAGAILIDTFAAGPALAMRRANGTNAAKSALAANDAILTIDGYGYGSTGYSSTSRARVQFQASQTWTDANQGTQCLIQVTPNSTTTPVTAMRITQSATWVNDTAGLSVTTSVAARNATATPAAASAVSAFQMGSAAIILTWGTGSPNTALTAPKGSLFIRTDGSTTNDRMYINTDGSTAWTNFTTAA